ncbi:BQ5605_C006g04170 [Microbotryum silenes-dioicae]|uniref:BQ5605_C006g04170 protein n=1 Tax=Microbotryum silenes-dioicae TaxID=796604 RepID=A0A2X0N0E7_9BASI|nr:BQ5605_C006g04170 [Microbotryum silenes-dioicae]
MKRAETQPTYNSADAQRRPLSIDDLPDGNYGHAVLAQDTAQVIWMPPVYLRDADIERVGRPELFFRQIGLELATPEAVVVDALQHIRDKFAKEMAPACSIATDSYYQAAIPFNTSSLNVNPRIVFLHHQLVTLHAHWTSVTGGDPIPEKGGHPPLPMWETDVDRTKYHTFYENAAEGIFNGRKVAKSHATPLPVNVDGHADLYTHHPKGGGCLFSHVLNTRQSVEVKGHGKIQRKD